jgi:cell wall-associated NlpC family hydrolase
MAELHRIKSPVANLLRAVDGALERQLLFGEGFNVVGTDDGWAKGSREKDGYRGYIKQSDLAPWIAPTHQVTAIGAHVYSEPDIKTVPDMHLPFQAEITVLYEEGDFARLEGSGYVHQQQIGLIGSLEADYVKTAQRFMGVPYLWGGNSQYGIDCSGLISAAMKGAGIECAADSGDQETSIGEYIDADTPLRRGDLIFWKGHVGLMTSPDMLLHANGYHMKVMLEPLGVVIKRIASSGGDDVAARKRIQS